MPNSGTSVCGAVVLTIHDAVYVETPNEEAGKARDILRTEMEAAVEMPLVPLEVDIES